jgi:hypothetical protein
MFFFRLPNTWKPRGPSRGCTVVAEVQQDVFYHEGLENLIVRYDNCRKRFGTAWTHVQIYPCAVLVSTLLHPSKK